MFPAGAAACCMPADEIRPHVPAWLGRPGEGLAPSPQPRLITATGRRSLCGKGKLLARQREINMRRPAPTKKRVFLWFEAPLQAKSCTVRGWGWGWRKGSWSCGNVC